MTNPEPVEPTFRRIAIVNRGECAMRLIRAVHELNRERDLGLTTIALFTEPERRALFVREADEAVCLGSATFVDPRDGRRKNRYLDYAGLERALVESGAEAAWVGWGFVSEHTEFAELCRKLGVAFIGPDPEVMRALGDKIGSKRAAEEAKVPLAPWSGGPVEDLDHARAEAKRLGFPLMVKATAGGGGRGIRRVRSEGELREAFESARSEALAGFGDATVFMERLVEGARHIEVQIVGDGQGTTWALGVRDCTVQRRNQKVIEESPSPALTDEQGRSVCEAASRLGDRTGYRGAGTVEFLYDPDVDDFSFMEVNARLQVEHPVTECTTGADLVKLQLHVAWGGRLEGAAPTPRGHAIEVRVNAEDPERGFAPAPGDIELLRPPGGPGLRVDSGFIEGDRIASEFDSMLAKVIAYGADRAEALARLRRALAEMKLAVRGGASNRGFLLGLLGREEVQSGEVDVGWLDRLAAEGAHLTDEHADVALVVAAIEAYDAELANERSTFYAFAARGRLRVPKEIGFELELRLRGARHALRVLRVGPSHYRVEVDGRQVRADRESLGRLERRITIGARTFSALTFRDGPDQIVEVEGIPHRVSRDDVGMVRSPAPAVVLRIAVEAGQRVALGDRLAVLEAMKTEMPVLAPCSGVVGRILVSPNVQVDAGAPLLVLEPSARDADADGASRVDFTSMAAESDPADEGEGRLAYLLEALQRAMLGFDFGADGIAELREAWSAACGEVSAADAGLLRGELEILAVFADNCALFEHRTAQADLAEGEVRTPEEYLLLFLRSLDPAAAGLSPSFVTRLQRALAHYDVDELDRTPALEDALLFACRAHARIDELVDVVLAILERRLDHADEIAEETGPELREVLDRIVTATTGSHQAVSDFARAVRYRYYDRPFFERIESRTYENVEAQLAAAARDSRRGRLDRIRSLVECPQPLAPLLTSRLESEPANLRQLSLEILLRRYYRIRSLEEVRSFTEGERSFARARYAHPDGPAIEALTSHARFEDLEPALAELEAVLGEVEPRSEVVVDLFLWRDEALDDPDATAEALRARLEAAALHRPLRRVVFAVAAPGGGRGMKALQQFTFRPGETGFVEERTSRGLHPMMGKRLQLWRLANFEIERVPSVEDVYLFHGVARDNPKDERLFAFAEVRDLSPMRDEGPGHGFSLPHLEMQFLEALAAIRLFQSHRSSRSRLHWNRVVLYVWPPLELSVDEIHAMAQRLLPAAEGLGLQKTVLRARLPDPDEGELRDTVIQIGSPEEREVEVRFTAVADRPIAPLSPYDQRVVRMRRRGMTYPYELIRMLTPDGSAARTDFPPGGFLEYDLDDAERLVPVDRSPGRNVANLVVGVITNETPKHPEGLKRVLIVGDPSREMGSFAEPECRRIIGAVDLAESLGVPLEWFPISAGAKIAMDSGTENLDWTAAALRRLVEFTQHGGEVNLVVAGINVGGQSYWNAEATMLMHTRGILVMTPDASMVLTGKKALDYSGGVSAEDHQGIGGYDRVMGVNGEGQYWARNLGDACRILLRYYEHAYVAPGERFPRRATTHDPVERDIRSFPYGDEAERPFSSIGEIFSPEHNPGRRKPFEIRRVMRAVVDQDHTPLERWADMREAEVAVVWDAHLTGIPVCLIGLESRPMTRLGFVPADGPDQWTAGTLFPLSSKKVARAINAASGSRPVVVLANLSGFDGSPESLRRLQLEYGAEIGRAVVNFEGPIVFCVVGRYHGGAYVVFSRRLNENLEVAALEGSYASVIGGAPAAAVVFAGEVDRRTRTDSRLQELEAEIAAADDAARSRLRARWHVLYEEVHSEKLGEVADEFDGIHDVHRAKSVGSLDEIVEAGRLRPYLAEAVERGIQRALEGEPG
jgi:acetyl/propionyl-CoA carboxylase alpha subunit/acetyl-CoA carboxylase carboxyltransferase component